MLLTAAVLAIFVYGIIAAMLGTILPAISQKYNMTPKQNGNVAMSQAIGLMIGSFFVGPFIDVEGLKLGLVIGLALITAALVGLRQAGGYGSVAGFMMLLGVGGGAVVVAANGLPPFIKIQTLSAAGVANILNLFFGLGGLVTPLVAARVFRNNAQKLLVFAASIVLLALSAAGITEMPAASGKVGFDSSQVGALLGTPALLMLALTLFLYVAVEVGVWNWLVRHLMAQGLAEQKALTILSLGFALGLLLGRVAISPVLTSVSPERVLLGSAIFMTITTVAMLQSASPVIAWVLVFLAGAAMAPVFPTALSLVGARFPDNAATAIGIAATAGWLGLVCASPLIGALAGDDPKKLKTALLVLPAASAVMAVVCFNL